MTPYALVVALSDGCRDALRFWPMITAAFVHAIASSLLLGLSLQQASEAREITRHLERWETTGAASLHGLYLAGPDQVDGGATSGRSAQLDGGPVADGQAEVTGADLASPTHGEVPVEFVSLLEDPDRLVYTVDFHGDRFGDDLPGALIVTEDLLPAFGFDASMERTGQNVPKDRSGAPAPYAVIGSASPARGSPALAVDGALPAPSHMEFHGAMIPVVGELPQDSTILDPNMGSVSLDEAVLIVTPAGMLPQLYSRFELEALLLRTVALGPDAADVLGAAGQSLESDALLVTAAPLTSASSALLQSLSSSALTLVVLFGAAVLGAAVSLFGALGVLARALNPTWRIAALVGAARWQVTVRIAVPVVLAWVLPAGAGLVLAASVLPGSPSIELMAGAMSVVMLLGVVAALSSRKDLRSAFSRPRPRISSIVKELP